jgi:hypothetical protein
MFDPLHYSSDLPSFDPATLDGMVHYYHLMAKVDWLRWCTVFSRVGLSQVDRVGLVLEDEALTPRVVGRRHFLPERRLALGLVATCLRCFRGDRVCTTRRGGSSCPAAGQPRPPLGVHRVIAEVELVPRQCLLLLQSKHKHRGGERREAKELLGRART